MISPGPKGCCNRPLHSKAFAWPQAGQPAAQGDLSFRPGDLALFDNRRTLHGRTAIDETGGVRELHGTYIDHDEIYSRTRVLTRHRTARELGLA